MKNVFIALGLALLIIGGIWWYTSRDHSEVEIVSENEGATGSGMTFETVPSESDKTMDEGSYEADTEISSIEWEAGKPAIAGYVHHGTFSLESGTVTLAGQELTGEFVIDMNSLQVTSLGGGKVGQESALEGHLKGERFFDVANNATATFTITDVTPKVLPGPDQAEYTATGELTMKGKTHELTFPMKVVVDENDQAWVTADVEIDRTKWGIDFGSASIAESITDNIIGDTVGLELTVKLTK